MPDLFGEDRREVPRKREKAATEEERKRRHAEARKRWAERNKDKLTAAKKRYNATEHGRAKGREQAKKWREANPEKQREMRRAWAVANPEKVRAGRVRRRLRAIGREREQARRRSLAFHYEMTIEEYNALLVAQGDCCAICGTEKSNGRGHQLHVDHCHESGLVRGLLCNKCNSALGYFDDSPKRLRRAAAYLESWRGKTAPDERRGFQPVLGIAS